VSADAIVRTLVRLFSTKRRLLEWQTASQTERTTTGSGREVWRRMLPAEALTAVIAAVVGLAAWQRGGVDLAPGAFHLPTLAVAVPLLVLWAVSPIIVHALSAPALRRELRLAADQRDRAMR
jgi:cyclic beta-1,2-glucan synthetase